MGDYERSASVAVRPAQLFSYLADVTRLPEYMPNMTSAVPTHDDKVSVSAHIDPPNSPEQDVQSEAWIDVVTEGRTLRWGAPGPDDYSGELDVDPGDDDSHSLLTVRLHTEQVEGSPIQDGMDDVLKGLRQALEAADHA